MKGKPSPFISYFIIVVAALGYFVDIYDLILFNVVKKESLQALLTNATAAEIKSTGIFLFNIQMTGMLIGGILWGIWGDKRGRLSVLFGSILLYSAANIANAFVTTVPAYAFVRLVAGIGLAGELGAGITLVSETMSKEKRGYGTMIVVAFGVLGTVVAAWVSERGHSLAAFLGDILNTTLANWQVAYLLGGTMGLLLLLLRVGTIESGMFKEVLNTRVAKGDIRMLFNHRERFFKYLNCILVGLPIWYFIGLVVANSESIWAAELQVQGQVVNGTALMYAYIGLSVGDVVSGLLSQLLKSRRKVVFIFVFLSFALLVYYLFFATGISLQGFYKLSFLVGMATGYWAIFVTIAAEQFGTNIRSTVTGTTPNFVRGSVPVITMLFQFLTAHSISNIGSAFVVGALCMALSLWAVYNMKETFAKDLNYAEQPS